jgi:hypothetical protein
MSKMKKSCDKEKSRKQQAGWAVRACTTVSGRIGAATQELNFRGNYGWLHESRMRFRHERMRFVNSPAKWKLGM